MDGVRDRVLALEVDPGGKMHQGLRKFLHLEGVQGGRANNHLEPSPVRRHLRNAAISDKRSHKLMVIKWCLLELFYFDIKL